MPVEKLNTLLMKREVISLGEVSKNRKAVR